MQKIGKYISTILIIALIGVGITLAFSTKEGKWSFYFFATAVILVMVFSLFVLLGNISKNKALMGNIGNAIEKGLENPELLNTIANIFKKTPYPYPYVQNQMQTNQTNNTNIPTRL